jgi:pyrroloquinoline-quinone synthase
MEPTFSLPLPLPLASLRDELFAARIEKHPLFERLTHGSFSRDAERRVALEIFHVVEAFPLFLSALITSIDDFRLRMELVDNLYEEHGRMNPERVHVVTYRGFLRALGVSEEVFAASRPELPSLCYNRALLDLCGRQSMAEGLGALAVIEEIVARVSPLAAAVGRARSGGGPIGAHFGSHEVLDVSHAEELYAVALRLPAASTPLVQRGMRLGMYYHHRLYDDLVSFAEAEQRPDCAPLLSQTG